MWKSWEDTWPRIELSPEQIARLASKLCASEGSKANRIEIVKLLQNLKDYMNASGANYDTALAADYKQSGIAEMLGQLTNAMDTELLRSQRAEGALYKASRRVQQSAEQLKAQQQAQTDAAQSAVQGRMTNEQLIILHDVLSAMVTLAQNANKLMAAKTNLAASEFAINAVNNVRNSPHKLGKALGAAKLLFGKYQANVLNAARSLKRMGGYIHAVLAGMLGKGWLLHNLDREKDENGNFTVLSVGGRLTSLTAESLLGNVYGLQEAWNTIGNIFGDGSSDPISLTGIDAISDFARNLRRLNSEWKKLWAAEEPERDWLTFWSRFLDVGASLGNLTGIPAGQVQRLIQGGYGWVKDFYTAATNEDVSFGDILTAPRIILQPVRPPLCSGL